MKITMPDGKVKEENIGPISLEALLGDLGISMSEVLVARNSEIIPEDCIIDNGDDIRIIHVVFGG